MHTVYLDQSGVGEGEELGDREAQSGHSVLWC